MTFLRKGCSYSYSAAANAGLVRQVHFAVDAAVHRLRNRSRLEIEELSSGGLKAADAARLAGDRGVRDLRLQMLRSEIIGLGEAFRHLSWTRNLLKDLGFELNPTVVYEDNAATISIAARPYLTSRTRHIHLRDLYVRELVTNGDVEIRYVKTNENIVGFFANPSRLPRSASTAISSWASARSSARELRLHASCAATSTSRRQVAQSRQLALSGNAGVSGSATTTVRQA